MHKQINVVYERWHLLLVHDQGLPPCFSSCSFSSSDVNSLFNCNSWAHTPAQIGVAMDVAGNDNATYIFLKIDYQHWLLEPKRVGQGIGI